MQISHKNQTKKIKLNNSTTAYEYPIMDNAIHGAVVELNGRYPEEGRVVNEKVYELGFVIKGSGRIVIEGEEIEFQEGDQLLIKPGQKYYWDAKATLFMPCAPAWYHEQHREIK